MIDLWIPQVVKIYDALNGQMRLVGGCVRDFLLGRKPYDIDIATPLHPEAVLRALESCRIKARMVSPRHGVVSARVAGMCFEVTTLRQESYETGREVITFITDYEQDARRRDFTMNALSMDREKVYDYFNGQADLEDGSIRFIGEPAVRISEDPLRLMRYIRFWSYFGKGKPDCGVLSLSSQFRTKMETVSFYRRKKEFSRILMSPRVLDALRLMINGGLMPCVAEEPDLPKLEQILKEKPTASLAERLACFGHYNNRKEKT